MKFQLILLCAAGFAGCIPMPIYNSSATSQKTNTQSQTVKEDTRDSSKIISTENQSNQNISKEQRDLLIGEIKSWLGTPYKFGVVEKGKGTDCSGFVGYLFSKVLGKTLPRQSNDMYELGQSVSQDQLQFGDLVFFQNTYKGSSGASHVGVFTGNGQFAHASTTVGVTYSKLSETYYAKHFLGCKRIMGLDK